MAGQTNRRPRDGLESGCELLALSKSVNVACGTESRVVSRQQAWRDYCSRHLLDELGAEPGRLADVAAVFRVDLRRAPTQPLREFGPYAHCG